MNNIVIGQDLIFTMPCRFCGKEREYIAKTVTGTMKGSFTHSIPTFEIAYSANGECECNTHEMGKMVVPRKNVKFNW